MYNSNQKYLKVCNTFPRLFLWGIDHLLTKLQLLITTLISKVAMSLRLLKYVEEPIPDEMP